MHAACRMYYDRVQHAYRRKQAAHPRMQVAYRRIVRNAGRLRSSFRRRRPAKILEANIEYFYSVFQANKNIFVSVSVFP